MSLLNVKAHPHDDGASTYAKLWRAAVDQETSAQFHGDKIARIGSANPDLILGPNALAGTIWTYTTVGGKNVLNVKEKRRLDPAEFKLIQFDWAAHGFNYREFNYVFLPELHRVGFEWKNGLSPRFLKWMLQTILNDPGVLAAAGANHVDVEMEQEESQLEQIFALKLDALTVFLTRPNPDDITGSEEDFRRNLAEQNAESQEVVLKAARGARLAPNAQTQLMAKVALSNGHVSGHGRDSANRTRTLDTTEKPLRQPEEWNPTVESLYQVLARGTASIADKIRSRLRR